MEREGAGKILVLGVGNILLRDEGLGVRAAEYVKENFLLPPCVEVADGGTGGLALLSLLRDFGHVIILDAVAPRSGPGTLYRIPARELRKSPPLMTTAHQIGVQDMLALAELEEVRAEVVIIGMEPRDTTPGLDLSAVVRERLPRLADAVREELEGLGVEVRRRHADA